MREFERGLIACPQSESNLPTKASCFHAIRSSIRGRTRTCDLVVRSHALCPLSYTDITRGLYLTELSPCSAWRSGFEPETSPLVVRRESNSLESAPHADAYPFGFVPIHSRWIEQLPAGEPGKPDRESNPLRMPMLPPPGRMYVAIESSIASTLTRRSRCKRESCR